jgi:hypothetical protein
MRVRIDEIGEELSGIFRATFEGDDGKYHLQIDTNEFDELPFLMGGAWLKTFQPEVMDLYFGLDYDDIPVEYSRKIYEVLAKNGWSEHND